MGMGRDLQFIIFFFLMIILSIAREVMQNYKMGIYWNLCVILIMEKSGSFPEYSGRSEMYKFLCS